MTYRSTSPARCKSPATVAPALDEQLHHAVGAQVVEDGAEVAAPPAEQGCTLAASGAEPSTTRRGSTEPLRGSTGGR